ncbi:hypothetical protein E1B28_002006 [Marasmius oreades]|uniref:Uncharacterized protein n=1 Tax=Marasmius oreades TaxID=181124 RepID=A0A9P7V4T2_9AGAR|nr:uncharacterized protein E1B28_002006 [Marasmius oreades]KAG7100232.1 hypothetical protein E1B28_002006 [Marasmius oreades]
MSLLIRFLADPFAFRTMVFCTSSLPYLLASFQTVKDSILAVGPGRRTLNLPPVEGLFQTIGAPR